MLKSRIVQVILLVLIVVVGVNAYDRYKIATEMKERHLEALNEVSKLEERKTELEAQVQYLSHERGLEAEMRRQFDVAKEGEQVVIIINDDENSTVEPLPPLEATTTADRAWYEFW